MLPTPPASPKPFESCSSNPEDRLDHLLAGRYRLTDTLGVGAYGTVYKAYDVETGTQYAVKALNRVGVDPRQADFQRREILLHYRAREHANVVSMESILESDDCTYVVLEYCSEGDLFAKITEEGDYIGLDNKARAVFLQILDAVQHCHTNGIYHRDLKPENVLVQDNGWTVKLADFGLATEDPLTSDFGCGSTFYMSPECQQSNPKPFACYSSEANDVWSLGVILVNLVCGRNPWKRATLDDSTFRAYIRDRNFLQSILPISNGLNMILQRIFEPNPRLRVSLNELRHLIRICPQLSQEAVDTSLPPTPEYSPIEKPVDTSVAFYGNGLESIPQIEPLPVQQFPFHNPSPQFNSPQPVSAPIDIPTPPGSMHNSPHHSPYTFPAKPATNVHTGPFAGSAGYIPNFQWPRCSYFVPNLANQMCFRNALVA